MSFNGAARKYFIQASQGLNGQSQQQAARGLLNTGQANQIYQNAQNAIGAQQYAQQAYPASIEDTAPSEYWTPIEEVKPETEEQKQQRLWQAVIESSRS
jgi:hypothetical protein